MMNKAISLHEISTNTAADLPLSARIAIFPFGWNAPLGRKRQGAANGSALLLVW